jgi:hypothetical protein
MAQSQLDDKNHDHREGFSRNRLVVVVECPYHEAIIDENRIEQALRAATAVPDLRVRTVGFEVLELI